MKRFRLISQITFFAIFILIFFNAIIDLNDFSGGFSLKGGIKYIFIVNPLITINTFLASHRFELIYGFSIIFILLTLVLGRFFCGWVCPFGTIHHFFSFIASKLNFYKKDNKQTNFYRLKYYLLFFILFTAIFGINLSGYFDPLSIVVKGFGIFLLPILSLFYKLEFLPDSIKDFLFYNILGREDYYYGQAFAVGFFFLLLIVLNFYKSRFWCVYLCPLGGLYGLLSKYSLFKIRRDDSCLNCGICNKYCIAQTEPGSESFKSSECMLLFDCVDRCSVRALDYTFYNKSSKIDLTRRGMVSSSVSALVGMSLINVSLIKPEKNPSLLRPPGAENEKDFLALCIRCGGCMKVCPENFLQPAFLQAGIIGYWTPIGNPSFGYCVYNCNLCGQICPTGAIKNLAIEDKKRFVIGTAFIDKNRCLPYAYNVNCMVCEEHCPTSPKAIFFYEHTVLKNGKEYIVKNPMVNPELCIGCGICTYKCPVSDMPAIYVTSIKKGGLLT